MRLTINKNKCPVMAAYPMGALTQNNIFSLPVIAQDKCVVCGKYIRFCPKGAFEKHGE